MPGFNGSGPQGGGPKTGRGLGYCDDEYGTPAYGRGLGRGLGRGFGRALGRGCWQVMSNRMYYNADEKTLLEREKQALEGRLKDINTSLDNYKKDE